MISVIFCHHKGHLIDNAIASVKASRKFDDIEIIVATSVPEKSFNGTRTIFVKGGPAHKRNIAVRYASGDKVAFLDDDVEIEKDALYEMAKELEKPEVGMVFGKLLNMEFRNRFDEAGSFLTWSGFLWARAESGVEDVGQFEKVCPVLAGKSASCMIKRKAFGLAGLFDASYEILGEETDLAWRVWLFGYRVHYVPQSIAYHAFNTRFKPADFYIPRRVYFNGCRNYITMLITNLGNHNVFIPVITNSCVWFFAALGMLLTGKYEAGKNILLGLLYVIKNFCVILGKRHRVQSRRLVSDKELLPIIMKNPPIKYYTDRFFHYIKTGRHG